MVRFSSLPQTRKKGCSPMALAPKCTVSIVIAALDCRWLAASRGSGYLPVVCHMLGRA